MSFASPRWSECCAHLWRAGSQDRTHGQQQGRSGGAREAVSPKGLSIKLEAGWTKALEEKTQVRWHNIAQRFFMWFACAFRSAVAPPKRKCWQTLAWKHWKTLSCSTYSTASPTVVHACCSAPKIEVLTSACKHRTSYVNISGLCCSAPEKEALTSLPYVIFTLAVAPQNGSVDKGLRSCCCCCCSAAVAVAATFVTVFPVPAPSDHLLWSKCLVILQNSLLILTEKPPPLCVKNRGIPDQPLSPPSLLKQRKLQLQMQPSWSVSQSVSQSVSNPIKLF